MSTSSGLPLALVRIAESERLTRLMLAVVLVGLTAIAFAPVASAEAVYACVHKTTGSVRIMSIPGQCQTNSERELSWESGSDLDQAVNSLIGRVDAIESAIGMINSPPTVNIGADRIMLLDDSAHFVAVADDDGLLRPLTFLWKSTGPGASVFTNSTSLTTDVSFDEAGTYEVSLSVYDGLVRVEDSANVIVFPVNIAPTVSAGTSRDIVGTTTHPTVDEWTFTCTVPLSDATATDDGLPAPLTFRWIVDAALDMGGSGDWRLSNDTALNPTLDLTMRYAFNPYFQPPAAFLLELEAFDGYHRILSNQISIRCLTH